MPRCPPRRLRSADVILHGPVHRLDRLAWRVVGRSSRLERRLEVIQPLLESHLSPRRPFGAWGGAAVVPRPPPRTCARLARCLTRRSSRASGRSTCPPTDSAWISGWVVVDERNSPHSRVQGTHIVGATVAGAYSTWECLRHDEAL